MKTITISDEVYWKLVSIKGNKSFSEIIDELIRRNMEIRVKKIIELAGYGDKEAADVLEDIMNKVRDSFRVRV